LKQRKGADVTMQLPLINHIVLADDDPDHAFLFKRILHKVDPSKTLIHVKNGAELMDLLSVTKPDILFLDLKMPCKNGHECLEEIRQNPSLHNLCIVVYSSSVEMNNIKRCYNNKADLYIVKPFSSEHLTHALSSILKSDSQKNLFRNYHYFINNKFVPFTAIA
jgi:CheY-like chemotaxis protein